MTERSRQEGWCVLAFRVESGGGLSWLVLWLCVLGRENRVNECIDATGEGLSSGSQSIMVRRTRQQTGKA